VNRLCEESHRAGNAQRNAAFKSPMDAMPHVDRIREEFPGVTGI
jgi:hypothetical protein